MGGVLAHASERYGALVVDGGCSDVFAELTFSCALAEHAMNAATGFCCDPTKALGESPYMWDPSAVC